MTMAKETTTLSAPNWRQELPALSARLVTLREPTLADLRSLMDLLLLADASRFGIDEPPSEVAVQHMLERITNERSSGVAFTYAISASSTRTIVGLVQVRQIDLSWESAEWECTLAPSWRGTGAFLETARLVGSFAFGTVGVHLLEARVLVQNGRGNGALNKLGAIQEAVLRRSFLKNGEYFDQALWVLERDGHGNRRTDPAALTIH